jgi:hypothetical protein
VLNLVAHLKGRTWAQMEDNIKMDLGMCDCKLHSSGSEWLCCYERGGETSRSVKRRDVVDKLSD